MTLVMLVQGCPIPLMEDQHPAEFSSNQLQHTYLESKAT